MEAPQLLLWLAVLSVKVAGFALVSLCIAVVWASLPPRSRAWLPAAWDADVYRWGVWGRVWLLYGAVFPLVDTLFGPCRRRWVGPQPGDSLVSPAWVSAILRQGGCLPDGVTVSATSLSTDGLEGGFVGDMCRVELRYATQSPGGQLPSARMPASVVVKMQARGLAKSAVSIMLGAAREAWFYNQLANDWKGWRVLPTPRVYFARGNMWTGRYTVVMEDLSSAAKCHHICGNQCWGTPPPVPRGAPTMLQVFEAAFCGLADMHAEFWGDQSLLQHRHLNSATMWTGRNRTRFLVAKGSVEAKWSRLRAALAEGGPLHKKLVISEVVARCLTESLRVSTWEAYQRMCVLARCVAFAGGAWCTHCEFNAYLRMPRYSTTSGLPFTLVHGDTHAANLLWRMGPGEPTLGKNNQSKPGLVAVDWSDVGIRHGATELAMMLITHGAPSFRRKHERKLVELCVAARWGVLPPCLTRRVGQVLEAFGGEWARQCGRLPPLSVLEAIRARWGRAMAANASARDVCQHRWWVAGPCCTVVS